jgi:hypothetical protein
MKKHHIALIAFFLIIVFIDRIGAHSSPIINAYQNFSEIDFATSRCADIEDFTLSRDVATFHLLKGTIYFFEPDTVNASEVVTGAVFIGEGIFDFFPPTKFELRQLKRFYRSEIIESEHYQQRFQVLFLRFADSTYNEIAQKFQLQSIQPPREVGHEVAYCTKYLSDWDDRISYYILSSFLWNCKDKFFYAHLYEHKAKSVFFIYNPNHVEEVNFLNRESEINYRTQTICQFHKQSDYRENIDITTETKDQICITRYCIESQIDDKGLFSGSAKLFFKPLKDNVVLLPFGLAEKLEVQQILDENSRSLDFIKKKESNLLLVVFPKPIDKESQSNITIQYAGDVLLKEWDCFYPPINESWYPYYSSDRRTEFELVFKIPSDLDCISAGNKVSDSTNAGIRTICWHERNPIDHPYFLIGKLLYERREAFGDVPVTIIYTKESHAELINALQERKLRIPSNLEARIAADVANSIKLFSHTFGEFPLEKLQVIQGPYNLALSLPGLIILPWYRFQFLSDLGNAEMVRAHEVAHQWWGKAVERKTYHDVWLIEGFAQYAGLWYLQWATQDNELYFNNLKHWNEQIIKYREFAIKNGAEPGPIWLGYRLKMVDTESEYYLFVYRKAAYVIHMLRNMMMDLNTMDEGAFISMLQDFYVTYRGKEISTDDFKRIVEQHIGENMDWFFQQWIYGSDIPTYCVSHRTFEQPDGTYLTRLRVTQKNVPDDFKMYVPLTIRYKDEHAKRIRLTIDKPFEEFSIRSASKPEEIVFNDFSSVLAKVKYEKFKE